MEEEQQKKKEGLWKALEHYRYLILVPVIIMWLTYLATYYFAISLNHLGVMPRSIDGLKGIFLMPYIHKDIAHLVGNTGPILALGFMLVSSYPKVAYWVMGVIYLFSGGMTWIFGRSFTFHIGASGIVYGLAVFIIATGLLNRDLKSSALAFIVVFFYGGSILWGVLPIYEGISWEAHLFGALGGATCAYLFRKPSTEPRIERSSQPHFFEQDETDDIGK